MMNTRAEETMQRAAAPYSVLILTYPAVLYVALGPGGPGLPCLPGLPVGPMCPAGPVFPGGPGAPSGPFGPGGPGGPLSPASPLLPCFPLCPGTPGTTLTTVFIAAPAAAAPNFFAASQGPVVSPRRTTAERAGAARDWSTASTANATSDDAVGGSSSDSQGRWCSASIWPVASTSRACLGTPVASSPHARGSRRAGSNSTHKGTHPRPTALCELRTIRKAASPTRAIRP
mmetsp:Transcript_35631/g.80495  ORF Transcript_35631/g.80495 Transcript_35631/m.80495 type:complete len:230 (+) Transcript_35631:151-840(+)